MSLLELKKLMNKNNDMNYFLYKKIIFILYFVIFNAINTYSQIVEIRYLDYDVRTFAKISAYDFNRYKLDIIVLKDSLSYNIVNDYFSDLQYYCDTCTVRFPDVRRQIILIEKEEYYKILSYDQFSMELNGRPVFFDKQLYEIIEDVISKHKKKGDK
jgi:hypothetical protein